MATFISKNDLMVQIKDQNLQRMIEQDDGLIDVAATTATATVRESLAGRFDVATIFSKTGDDRHPVIVRWVCVLTLYYLYERLPANFLPQRVSDNYKEVQAWLKEVEDGKKPLDLPHLLKADGSSSVTKFRWGTALPPRSH